LEREKGIEPST